MRGGAGPQSVCICTSERGWLGLASSPERPAVAGVVRTGDGAARKGAGVTCLPDETGVCLAEETGLIPEETGVGPPDVSPATGEACLTEGVTGVICLTVDGVAVDAVRTTEGVTGVICLTVDGVAVDAVRTTPASGDRPSDLCSFIFSTSVAVGNGRGISCLFGTAGPKFGCAQGDPELAGPTPAGSGVCLADNGIHAGDGDLEGFKVAIEFLGDCTKTASLEGLATGELLLWRTFLSSSCFGLKNAG